MSWFYKYISLAHTYFRPDSSQENRREKFVDDHYADKFLWNDDENSAGTNVIPMLHSDTYLSRDFSIYFTLVQFRVFELFRLQKCIWYNTTRNTYVSMGHLMTFSFVFSFKGNDNSQFFPAHLKLIISFNISSDFPFESTWIFIDLPSFNFLMSKDTS